MIASTASESWKLRMFASYVGASPLRAAMRGANAADSDIAVTVGLGMPETRFVILAEAARIYKLPRRDVISLLCFWSCSSDQSVEIGLMD